MTRCTRLKRNFKSCSTMMILRLFSFARAPIIVAMACRIIGATPAVGSSIRRSELSPIFIRKSSSNRSCPQERIPADASRYSKRFSSPKSSSIVSSIDCRYSPQNFHHHGYFFAYSMASMIFSLTVISRNTPADWKLRPIPDLAREYGESLVISCPWNQMEPCRGCTKPDTALRSVVFPHPFGQMIPTISPGATESETFLRISLSPNETERSFRVSIRRYV